MRIHQCIQCIHAVGLVQAHARQHPLHRRAQGFAEQRMVIGDEQGGHGLLPGWSKSPLPPFFKGGVPSVALPFKGWVPSVAVP